jgi:hypothetical protein
MRTKPQWYLTAAIGYDDLNNNFGRISGVSGDVGTGYNFVRHANKNGGLFIETKYDFMPERSGVNNNTLSVNLGYKF